ncbi:lipase 3-like isoform X2 [Anoplophora glabripennis]|uniref:lipase 3-like isoform X2 n=1 Tax=Anoplophora glabripennis TaxID=217634 RepID=UPI000873EAB2|nr:lipase 3-like isoform X2 [Anoplophora glabripennis]
MVKWSPLLILQMVAHVSISLKFITHPEADLNMEQKIKKHGYPLEIHEVITEDNYILTVHRVPHGRKPPNNRTNRSPVLLLHGMGAHPEYFLVLGRRSLVYYLADRDFDVWILNARGSPYSEKHKYFDVGDPKYWKFSFHEIGVYDIPANIDYIVNKTNQKVFVIGHSQGNTCYFVMATERPEYNDKVKISSVYAPSVLLKYMDYPFAVTFSYVVELFQEVASLLFSVRPVNIAARQLFHYMQNVKSGIFRQYDFGEIGNLERYKTKMPPEYNLTNAVAPVALFYAERDDVTSVKGAQETMKVLPNVIFSYKVPYKYFNHIDFLFGSNASTLVYKRNVQLFKDFDSGKMT